jgi:hypothetical protein
MKEGAGGCGIEEERERKRGSVKRLTTYDTK